MNKAMALLFIVGGIILLMMGYNEAHSMRSGFAHYFTGSPTDKSMWMLIAGGIATLAGLISLLTGSK
jgi:hypothetical protein